MRTKIAFLLICFWVAPNALAAETSGFVSAEEYLQEFDEDARLKYVQGVVDGMLHWQAMLDAASDEVSPRPTASSNTAEMYPVLIACLQDTKLGRIKQLADNEMRDDPLNWDENAGLFVVAAAMQICLKNASS